MYSKKFIAFSDKLFLFMAKESRLFCRACASNAVTSLADKARLAPFFAKKVFGLKILHNNSGKKIKYLNRLFFGAGDRIVDMAIEYLDTSMVMDASVCLNCGFWSTKEPFEDKMLEMLYGNYRSSEYNEERDIFEPGYRDTIAPCLGGDNEAVIRNNRLVQYLRSVSSFENVKPRTLLDWGGADGRFLPVVEWDAKKYCYDISCSPTVDGVVHLDSLDSIGKFDYVQLAHVLEHVPQPRGILKLVTDHMAPGGFVYVELPLELSATTLPRSIAECSPTLVVHEHINKFLPMTLEKMFCSLGLRVIDVSVDHYSTEWSDNIEVIRGLASIGL
jgi:hypothetical protein